MVKTLSAPSVASFAGVDFPAASVASEGDVVVWTFVHPAAVGFVPVLCVAEVGVCSFAPGGIPTVCIVVSSEDPTVGTLSVIRFDQSEVTLAFANADVVVYLVFDDEVPLVEACVAHPAAKSLGAEPLVFAAVETLAHEEAFALPADFA